VLVTDQYANPVSGQRRVFRRRCRRHFSNSNPVVTGANGTAAQSYTLPAIAGLVTINATVTGVSNPSVFTETGH